MIPAGLPVTTTPLFFPGSAGRLFGLYWAPADEPPPRHSVLFFPPFAEEMNKARRMIAMQARALARAGVGVLVPDLYGTGDSEGEFKDADWQVWCADMSAAARLLEERGVTSLSLWSLRTGVLLMMDVIDTLPCSPERILLWQPSPSGKLAMRQFIRIRVASEMQNPNATDAAVLYEELASGGVVEIGGYELSGSLYQAIVDRELTDGQLPAAIPAGWFEVVAAEGRDVGSAGQRVIRSWRDHGSTVVTGTAVGEPFWTTAEISVVPALLEVTTRFAMDGAA